MFSVKWRFWWSALHISFGLLIICPNRAQTDKAYPTTTHRAERLTNAPVVQLSGNLFQIGLARVNSKDRTITFPATINMSSNLIEFVCDGGETKLHESLFRTD